VKDENPDLKENLTPTLSLCTPCLPAVHVHKERGNVLAVGVLSPNFLRGEYSEFTKTTIPT